MGSNCLRPKCGVHVWGYQHQNFFWLQPNIPLPSINVFFNIWCSACHWLITNIQALPTALKSVHIGCEHMGLTSLAFIFSGLSNGFQCLCLNITYKHSPTFLCMVSKGGKALSLPNPFGCRMCATCALSLVRNLSLSHSYKVHS
mgnify:CR=1 FL=1